MNMESEIRHTIFASDLGLIGLAMTADGVCFLGFTEGPEHFVGILAAEYPKAMLRRDDDGLRQAAQAILGHMRDQPSELKLAEVGTPFQRRVWTMLRAIPAGQTRTYRQIAESLGNPQAVRAVARACATNPVSLLVPCHRVIRVDGSLAGYRWGLDRKRALLERESVR